MKIATVSPVFRENVEIEPTSGEELEALAKDVMAQPPQVVERKKKLMGK